MATLTNKDRRKALKDFDAQLQDTLTPKQWAVLWAFLRAPDICHDNQCEYVCKKLGHTRWGTTKSMIGKVDLIILRLILAEWYAG